MDKLFRNAIEAMPQGGEIAVDWELLRHPHSTRILKRVRFKTPFLGSAN
jgi:hypothetical protein